MIYTARFAHLQETILRPGQIISRGEIIGTMGNTGASTGTHLHLDVVEGLQIGRYTVNDIANGDPVPSPRQCVLFVDEELFRTAPAITTYYADPDYFLRFDKIHCGFDLVPQNRRTSRDHYKIHWNRSAPGKVVKIMENDPGYGNCVMIAYEVEGK